ncbi:hypothetical protein BDK51DRAFT_25749 [Blyttiomyces helicus]|uniref:Uncharacterized protein n=1 Tax=Blyttiomyces helicus TaxID=388810 RepID=A0A4P9WGK5_9FUNG|nr:hypothetical protein BDK51DRAFT_25749 [Blyttiomyces helicus]|eukprot:RKO91951.1 hypothetical protein BDK51DRAFT_25749 [Blyttiomyces helicus]
MSLKMGLKTAVAPSKDALRSTKKNCSVHKSESASTTSSGPSPTDAEAESWAAARLEAAMMRRLGLSDDQEVAPAKKRKRAEGEKDTRKRKGAKPNVADGWEEAEVLMVGHSFEDLRSDDDDDDEGEGEEVEEEAEGWGGDSDSEEEGSDSEEDGLSEEEESGGSQNVAIEAGPKVVVFNDTSVRKEGRGSKIEWKSFMSSNINKISTVAATSKGISKEDAAQDAEDDQHDRDLMDLLKATKLVEQFTASELTGKDRIKYQQQKLIELGGMPGKAAKAPLPIRLGMSKKGNERAVKRLQEAKDMGMYHSSLKTQILGDVAKKQAAQKAKRRKDGGGKGIDGGFGVFKDGTLHVAKRDIEAVGKGPKKIRSTSRISMGGPRSKPTKKAKGGKGSKGKSKGKARPSW